tara:strand:+ start:157 stop:576 length:420 start_codon:yes stop_codon:yes gene_type:complete
MKNKFFLQDSKVLAEKRLDVIEYLRIKNVSNATYLPAYDYFVINNTQFDGATIVKDLNDLPDLTLAACKHDHGYLTELALIPWYKLLKWLKTKVKLDWQYAKDLEDLGKGTWIPYGRAVSLIITIPLYPLYILYKKITS